MADPMVESCKNCGAELKFAPGTTFLKCAHCGTENTVQAAVTVLAKEPDYLVPLAVDEKQLRRAVHNFMAAGHLTPDDLLDAAKFTKMDLFYVPGYVFHGTYNATWTASFGYDRQENYIDFENRYDQNLKRDVRVPVNKTKTVTDWRPVNGSDSGSFSLPAYAGSAQPASVANLIAEMSWNDGKPFDRAFIAGYGTEEFAKSDAEVYRESVDGRVNAVIDAGVKSHAQGDRQRDWHWTANIDKAVTSYLLPVGWVKYEYAGKEYNYWIDGINSAKYVADKAPVDTKRRMALILGYVPAAVGLAMMGMVGKENSTLAGWLTFGALAWAGLRHFSIIRFSKARRQGALARKIAEEGNKHELTAAQEKSLTTAYSDVTPGFLASTARDKKLIPGIAAAVFALSLIPPIWSSSFVKNLRTSSPSPTYSEPVRKEPPRPVAAAPAPAPEPAPQPAPAATPAAEPSPPPAVAPAPATAPEPSPAAAAAAPRQEQAVAAPQPAAYVVEKSAPERKILLDTARPMVEKWLNPPVTFVVDTIRIAGDYAYLRMTPIRPTGEAIDTARTNLKNKNIGVLTQIVFKKEGSEWKFVAGNIGGNAGGNNEWAKKFCADPYPRDLTKTCD